MKEIIRTTALICAVGTTLLFACGEPKDLTDAEPPALGEYLPAANPSHVSVAVANPAEVFGEYTYEEFAANLQDEFSEGTVDRIALNEDKTWALSINSEAFIPLGKPRTKNADANYIDIPGDVPSVDPTLLNYVVASGFIQLSAPRSDGENILREIFPAELAAILDAEGLVLSRFNKGVFRVTDQAITINFKYKYEGDITIIYIDKSMMTATLGVAKELLGLIPSPTLDILDAGEYVAGYLKFLSDCTTFEIGTRMNVPL